VRVRTITFTPTLGLHPPTLLIYFFLSILYMHRAMIYYSTEDMRYTHLTRSSFPEVKQKAFHSLLQSLALSSASLTQYAKSNYNYHLHLASHTFPYFDHIDRTLALSIPTFSYNTYLYIYTLQNGPKHG
jgi:hypothetical protein